jgi:hypothetical protein
MHHELAIELFGCASFGRVNSQEPTFGEIVQPLHAIPQF